MHMYQKHILDLLRGEDSKRYADLQPDGVESSHFKYHLNQLINAGYVSHESRGVYSLTAKGRSHVDSLSVGSVLPEQTPKVITYSLLYDANSYYLNKKDKEPYRNLLNMIGGKLHMGETAEQAASRELREKVGLEGVEVSLRGSVGVRIMSGTTILSHVIAYVFSMHVAEIRVPDSLIKIDKHSIETEEGLAPDLLPILRLIETGELFVEEITAHM